MFNLFTSQKKQYFQRKLVAMKKMIWDLEFKRDKSLYVKEGFRQEYDRTQAKLHIILEQIKGQLVTPDKICAVHNQVEGKEKVHKDKGKCVCEYIENHIDVAEIEGLYDQKELLTRDIERLKGKMNDIDLSIHGSTPTNQYPEGVEGINDELEAIRELEIITKEYTKNLS